MNVRVPGLPEVERGPVGGVRAYLTMIDPDHESVVRILAATRGKDAA